MKDITIEEMRRQFAILKTEVNKQSIISDKLIKNTIEMNKREIDATKTMVYGSAAAGLFIFPLTAITHMWSWSFAIATCLMMLFCAVATYYIHKPVDRLDFAKDDVATVSQVMARFRRQYILWQRYITPLLLIPWISWACYEMVLKHLAKGINPWLAVLPLLAGVVVGGIAGHRKNRKTINAAQKISDEINGL